MKWNGVRAQKFIPKIKKKQIGDEIFVVSHRWRQTTASQVILEYLCMFDVDMLRQTREFFSRFDSVCSIPISFFFWPVSVGDCFYY